jgi:hypothetical protein
MSRSGYVDDLDCGYMNLYRGTVTRAINGKRGQAFLREMADAMDAMTEKVLISSELVNEEGDPCAIGSVCQARGIDTSETDPECPDSVGALVGISRTLAAEIEYINDEDDWYSWNSPETPQQRWIRVRKWADKQIITAE